MHASKDGTAIALLAQQAAASPSGRRFVASSVRCIIRGRVERRTFVRQLGATICSCGGVGVLRQVAAFAAADGDPIGQVASHELLSGFWLDGKI